MNAEWPRLTISSLIEDGIIRVLKDGNHGARYPRAAEFGDEGVPFLTAKLLDDSGNIDLDGAPRLSAIKASKFTFGFIESGDVLLSHNATVGRVAVVPELKEQVLIGTSLTHYRLDTTRLLPHYLAAFFAGTDFQNQLASVMSQTTRNQVPITSQKKLSIVLPPLPEQESIANRLGLLDEKIQLNHQINQTLEQMAQAIFKSWFVDFEPVKAKIAALEAGGSEEDALLAAMQAISGKGEAELTRLQAEQPEQYATLCATAELFPSAMQESELGEVPEGWIPTQVERFIGLSYGKALKKTVRIDGPYPVYGSGGITGSHNESLVSGPGIIVGRKGTVGSIYWESSDFYPIDTAYYVVPKNGSSLSFSYYLLQTLGLKDMNTDAAVPGLNRNNVYRLEVPSYPVPIIERFTQVADSISRKISAFNAESELLTELRDSLLPKLLSGELSVTAAENQIAEAAEPAGV